MKIYLTRPTPPPVLNMVFEIQEGWHLIDAFDLFISRYPDIKSVKEWRRELHQLIKESNE